MDSSNCQNRRSRRSHVMLAASIEQAGSARSVTLRNLSADGALIQSDDLPQTGSQVVFRRAELTVRGRVVWVEGRFAGVAFEEKLEPEQVLRHVPQGRPKVQLKPWRPGLTNDISAAERRSIESWMYSPSTAEPGE
jgi:hypothetical protein